MDTVQIKLNQIIIFEVRYVNEMIKSLQTFSIWPPGSRICKIQLFYTTVIVGKQLDIRQACTGFAHGL